MDKSIMTEKIIAAKESKELTWEAIASEVGVAPVYLASVCLGMNSIVPEKAIILSDFLGLDDEVTKALSEFPPKIWDQTVATDPLIYRFYEIAGVYGESVRQVVQEEFGDGIMSAIDFKLDIEREEDPKGDRVKIILNGKFLPYKAW